MQEKVVATIDDIILGDKIVSSMIVYVIGTALIAQVQNLLGDREALRCVAGERRFSGIARGAFLGICAALVAWFAVPFHSPRNPILTSNEGLGRQFAGPDT